MTLFDTIRSASHPLAVQLRALGRGAKERRELGMFVVEGPRGVAEALESGAALEWLLVAGGTVPGSEAGPLVSQCEDRGIAVHPIADALLERLAPSEHGPGLVAACRLPQRTDDIDSVLARAAAGPIVVCCGIQNPGNLGAILRSAAAFGGGGLIAAGGADPWHPKTVRASAGAIHRLAAARVENALAIPEALARHDVRAVAATARGGMAPEALDWRGAIALLLGAEVAGLPGELERRATRVTIRTSGAVESLSVPIAGSILLEHAWRSRNG